MYVCMYSIYGWIPFCNGIIENKRNKTKKKKKKKKLHTNACQNYLTTDMCNSLS